MKWGRFVNGRKTSSYILAAVFAGIMGPFSIVIHEIGGHWLVAKLLGAKNTSLGYSQVDCGSAKDWSPKRQLPINAGGPILTNFFIILGLKLLQAPGVKSKLFGWGLVLPAYRGLTIPLRQIWEDEAREFLTDESLMAQGLGVPKYLVSFPQSFFSGWVMFKGYCLLAKQSEKRHLVLLSAFFGYSVGTLLYLKWLGPLLFPQSVDFFEWLFNNKKPESRKETFTLW